MIGGDVGGGTRRFVRSKEWMNGEGRGEFLVVVVEVETAKGDEGRGEDDMPALLRAGRARFGSGDARGRERQRHGRTLLNCE